MTANDESNELKLRNCGYCGKQLNCSQVELMLHVHKCEKIKVDEYHSKRNK